MFVSSATMSTAANSLRDSELDERILSDNAAQAFSAWRSFLKCLWSVDAKQNLEAYFHFFTSECDTWRLNGRRLTIETYNDLLRLIRHLKEHRGEPWNQDEVLQFFSTSTRTTRKAMRIEKTYREFNTSSPLLRQYDHCDDDSISNSIYLAVRRWLMVYVGPDVYLSSYGRPGSGWNRSQSLDDLIKATFPEMKETLQPTRWPASLNVHSLERVSGFNVSWTNRLADHLLFDENSASTWIFHHVSFLQSRMSAKSADPILPTRLLEETL